MLSFDEPDLWRGILESIPIGLCIVDLQKRVVLWSDGAERITGYLRHEVIGHCCISEPLLHCDQPGCEFCSEECPIGRAMKTSHPAEATGFLHHKAGHEVPVRSRAVPVHNRRGSIVGALETFEDLQQVMGSERCIAPGHSAESVDAVTGTASRAMLELHLLRAFAAFREAQVPFGVLLVKVEKLAHFRASLGAEAAFSFLRLVARTLEGAVWPTDFVGRWADDQFLAVLNGCQEGALHSVRERARRTVAGDGIEWWGERHSIPVSIGEASMQQDDTLQSLLERAQTSLDLASAWRAGAASSERISGS